MANLLQVKNLHVDFQTDEAVVAAVRGISFQIPKNRTLGLVGESGSGKSVTALSIMRLVAQPPGRISGGEILLDGHNILKWPEHRMRKIRGARISMIFQEPMSSLNPVFTVGNQIAEALTLHQGLTKKQALLKTIDLMEQVEIQDASERVKSYPHQLSGGQRQRVMIAMAIACSPDLLIADEPTTALDVTIQQQIMVLLKSLQKKYGMSVLFITHNLGLIAEIADEVLVMHKGRLVEQNTTAALFQSAKHPYTKGLLACRPTMDKNFKRLPVMNDYMSPEGKELQPDKNKWGVKKIKNLSSREVLVKVDHLSRHFALKKNFFGKPLSWIKAVEDVSFTVRRGETLGLVGESGCGKTTLGRLILRLLPATAGSVCYRGQNIMNLSRKEMKPLRKKMQVIFQDPYSSLNPRMTIGQALMEPMIIHRIGENKKQRIKKTQELMERVGLTGDMLLRYPHEFSGGQRQRICIARALAVGPEFIICDESVSALDVSIQAQILNLLLDLQEEMNLSYIFISHDLAVVKFISDEVCVMNQGRIVEKNNATSIYKNPRQDYTKKLLQAIPSKIPGGTPAGQPAGGVPSAS